MEKLEIVELSHLEMISIDGGKSLSYYVGMFVGATVGNVVAIIKGFKDGLSEHHE
jgi:hypothetical protein